MKFTTSVAATLLAISTSVAAIRSKPFYLVAISDDASINGTAFNACHEGAGIEGLCKGVQVSKSKPAYTTYNFNYTKSDPNDGVLTYELIGGNFKESEPMSLYYDPSTNVALPLFEPGYDTTYVSFDSNDYMYIKGYLNDQVKPPTFRSPAAQLHRWYMCETYYTGYTYQTLSWVNGIYPPQNPSCVKIQVLRQFK